MLAHKGATVLLVIVIVGAVAAVAVWRVSMRLVGEVAEEFHEDPAVWKVRMIPFGMFGPLICRFLLTRRESGGGFA